jgi:hypothetical protein
MVFSYAFGYRSNSVFNLPVRWLLSLDYWLRFIDENCFDIVALVPYVCVRRGKGDDRSSLCATSYNRLLNLRVGYERR